VALGQVSLPVLYFFLSVSFQQSPTHVFIYTLFLPEGQTGEAWEPSKNNAVSEIWEDWIENYFQFFKLSFGKLSDAIGTAVHRQPRRRRRDQCYRRWWSSHSCVEELM
jgi:hypothetical protein